MDALHPCRMFHCSLMKKSMDRQLWTMYSTIVFLKDEVSQYSSLLGNRDNMKTDNINLRSEEWKEGDCLPLCQPFQFGWVQSLGGVPCSAQNKHATLDSREQNRGKPQNWDNCTWKEGNCKQPGCTVQRSDSSMRSPGTSREQEQLQLQWERECKERGKKGTAKNNPP